MLYQYAKQSHLNYFLIILIALFASIFFAPAAVHAEYRDTILSDSPLYYWPMDESSGATSLTAAVGGTAINLTGATTGVSGLIDGTAVSFNGTSNYGATASSINLTARNKIIVEGLFYFDVFNNTDDTAFETGTAYNTAGSFHFNPNSSSPSGTALPFLFGTVLSSAAYSRPSAASWHHVAVSYDMSASTNEVNLYIDGTLQTASSRPFNLNNTSNFGNLVFYLMSRAGSSLFTQGKVQHLAIYSSLSPSRILAHYQEAFASSFTSGTLSESSHSSSSATVSWTDAGGGTAPITAQLQRSPSSANTWSDISGATTSPVTDTGLSASTAYDYRVAYTDATPETIYSNTVTVTTDAPPTTTYTVEQSDLWDNGYDNIAAPRQSPFARFVFTTDAASITVTGNTTLYAYYPAYAHLGVNVDGVAQSPLVFSANGNQNFTVSLGTAGTTRTVEIITGSQSTSGTATSKGSFVNSITYSDTASFTVQTPTVGDRILFYGDSISVGGNSTNPEYQAYVPLLRTSYGHRTMLEGWGYRALYDDTNTTGLRNAFVSRLAGYTPSIIWFAIGTNDYGLNKWNATSFGTAYAATLDGLHTALPSARIICQTPLTRSTETANGSGSTLGNYRTQIATICNARSYATLVDGTSILTLSDLADGLHPTTAGFAEYALEINDILTTTPTLTTSTASSVLTTSAVLNGSISSVGSTTPTIRGFEYGLTTAYEIATTTDSGSFSTGDFNASISGLTPNTTYHFRSYATNFAGTAYGTDQTFTTDPLPTYTIGGAISGLTGTVVLQNNGGDNYSTSTNGSFVFATALNNSASYAVTVLTQPTGQTCTISSGSGTVSSANITNISITCVNTTKAITAFDFNGLTPAVVGTINETDKTIAVTVPYGTAITALVPTISHTGASISPLSGVAQSFSTPATYTVTAANDSTQSYTITVTIAPIDTHTITASAGANGSITPSGSVSVNDGSDQVFTITANSGYHIDTVTVDGGAVSAVSPYTFTNITADHTISATFTADVVVSYGGGGGMIPGWNNLPVMPADGFKIFINYGASITTNRIIHLNFNVGADIKKMAISLTGDFNDASQENYSPTKQIDLCSKFGVIRNQICPDGKYTIYAKFYTAFGVASPVVTSSIILATGTTNTTKYNFTRNLSLNATGADVKALQQYLNANGFVLAQSGAGSLGKETNYFGLLTYKALVAFQKSIGWSGTGFFGPMTRAFINK